MSDRAGASGLRNAAIQTLKMKAALARHLPEPDVEWRSRDLEPEFQRHTEQLQMLGIIEVVDQDPYENNSKTMNIYRTRPEAYRYVREVLGPQPGPCDHSGVRCIEAGEKYSCCTDDCEARFGPDVAERRIDERRDV